MSKPSAESGDLRLMLRIWRFVKPDLWTLILALALTPVIALTANAFSEDRQAALAAGMNDFLAKPLTRDALREVLTRWVTDPVHHEL